ncbi:MAG: ABC transporter permease [Promicromonosporaceae bacterium]|nr:ABC transporter permease [Promicromonosporaceae bacterium]
MSDTTTAAGGQKLRQATRLTSGQAAALAQQHGLIPAGIRPPLREYLKEIWKRRDFIWNLSASRAYARNQGSYLGQAWTVLRPILDAAVFVIIFGIVLQATGGMPNRIAFIVVGTFTYTLFNGSVMAGLNSIRGNLLLIRSHQFPRAVVPLASALTEIVLFGPILVAMFILVLLSGTLPGMAWVLPQWSWLLVPFAAALLALFSAGCSMIFARLGARIPDLGNVVSFLLSLGRFASGVMFPIIPMVGLGNPFGPMVVFQPMAIFLELFRSTLGVETRNATARVSTTTWQTPAPGVLWLVAAAWAVGIFALGFWFFWRTEETYGRD